MSQIRVEMCPVCGHLVPWFGAMCRACSDRHNAGRDEWGRRLERPPSRHCTDCGVGTVETGKSQCGRCIWSRAVAQQVEEIGITLEQAVAVLNERKHRTLSDWSVAGNHIRDPYVRCSPTGYIGLHSFYPFEAIAIAEKYMREGTHESHP